MVCSSYYTLDCRLYRMTKLTEQELAATIWVAENRGVLSKIVRLLNAQGFKCTNGFVGMVLQGKRRSTDFVVERALKRFGAPVRFARKPVKN